MKYLEALYWSQHAVRHKIQKGYPRPLVLPYAFGEGRRGDSGTGGGNTQLENQRAKNVARWHFASFLGGQLNWANRPKQSTIKTSNGERTGDGERPTAAANGGERRRRKRKKKTGRGQ